VAGVEEDVFENGIGDAQRLIQQEVTNQQ